MILEIPNLNAIENNIFTVISEDINNIKIPVYFKISDYLISVFEKSDLSKKNTLDELILSKFISKNLDKEQFVAFFVQNNNLFCFVKDKINYKVLKEYKSDIASLMSLFETYKNFDFFYLENEELNKNIITLKNIYEEEGENVKFFPIIEEFNNNDLKNIQENKNFLIHIKNIFFIIKDNFDYKNKKNKKNFYILSLLFLLLGSFFYYLHYLELKKEEELNKIDLKNIKPIITLNIINENKNKSVYLKNFFKTNNIDFLNIERNLISGLIFPIEKNEKEFYYQFGKGYFFEGKVENVLTLKIEDIKKEKIEYILSQSDLTNYLKKDNIIYVSDKINKEKLLLFFDNIAHNNLFVYDIFIKKIDNEEYFINLYLKNLKENK